MCPWDLLDIIRSPNTWCDRVGALILIIMNAEFSWSGHEEAGQTFRLPQVFYMV